MKNVPWLDVTIFFWTGDVASCWAGRKACARVSNGGVSCESFGSLVSICRLQ